MGRYSMAMRLSYSPCEWMLHHQHKLRHTRPRQDLARPSGWKDVTDSIQILREHSDQTKALHAKYASLRADRQRVHSRLLSSLRSGKIGTSHVDSLLDQELSLAAITASMDVCVARLKTLESRRENAVEVLAELSQRGEERAVKHVVDCMLPKARLSEDSDSITPRARVLAEQLDVATPKAKHPRAGNEARRKVQTIEVYMDEEIFMGDELVRYYENEFKGCNDVTK